MKALLSFLEPACGARQDKSRAKSVACLDISYLAPHATQEMKALLSFVAKVAADF